MPEPSLDERVRKLEEFRYRVIGRFNACQSLLFEIWLEHLKLNTADPVGYAEAMRQKWMKESETFADTTRGADPAALAMIQAEHQKALDELSGLLVRLARQAKQSDPEHNP